MATLAFKVAPFRNRWSLSHGDQPMAVFDTKAEAEKAAMAVAVRHPVDKTAKVDVESGDDPPSTLLIF